MGAGSQKDLHASESRKADFLVTCKALESLVGRSSMERDYVYEKNERV